MESNFGSHKGERLNSVCEEMWLLASLYADGEASPIESAQVEGHLAGCKDCARDFKAITGVAALLRATPVVAPPAGLRDAIFAATLRRKSLLERTVDGLRALTTAPVARYGAVAAAGAMAAILFSSSRPALIKQTGPEKRFASVSPMAPRPEQSAPAVKPNGDENRIADSTPITTQPKNDGMKRAALHLPLPPTNSLPLRVASGPAPATAGVKSSGLARKAGADGRRSTGDGRDFKAKPSQPTPPEDPMPPITVAKDADAPAGGGTMVPAVEMKEITKPAPGETETAAASAPASLKLVSGSVSMPADQAASLAGLKQALKTQRLDWNTSQVRQSIKDRQIRIDVIRGSF